MSEMLLQEFTVTESDSEKCKAEALLFSIKKCKIIDNITRRCRHAELE